MNIYLAKTDPDTYSIDDLARDGQTIWDGVHNYTAINVIKTMHPGDQVYIYHSQSAKAIVGLAEIVGEPFENTNDPRYSWAVNLKFVKKFSNPITLVQIKAAPECQNFLLIKQSRLSTMPVDADSAEWLQSHLT